MLNVVVEGNKAVIDVRENIKRGEHPRNEILKYVQSAPSGTVFEIHLPFKAEPLVNALTSIGMTAIIDKVEEDHYRLVAVNTNEQQ